MENKDDGGQQDHNHDKSSFVIKIPSYKEESWSSDVPASSSSMVKNAPSRNVILVSHRQEDVVKPLLKSPKQLCFMTAPFYVVGGNTILEHVD